MLINEVGTLAQAMRCGTVIRSDCGTFVSL
jgi:hypothetical protein